jgi:hypothetical protein
VLASGMRCARIHVIFVATFGFIKIVVCVVPLYIYILHIPAPVLAHIFAYFISHLNTGFQSTFPESRSEAYDSTTMYSPTNNF